MGQTATEFLFFYLLKSIGYATIYELTNLVRKVKGRLINANDYSN